VTTYLVPLPWTNPPLSGNRTRGNPHARAKEVEQAKGQARWAVRAARLPKLAGAEITLAFRVADKRRRDADNLAPTLKVCQDALVLEEVIPDDSWVHIPSATCRIHPPSAEGPAMWLAIDSLGAIA
jgi:Holliday junction resolvase RusA-like endonuclease